MEALRPDVTGASPSTRRPAGRGSGGGNGTHHPSKDEHDLRDRQMVELLNELRVALPGVQLLFAFLFTVPFTSRWGDLSFFQRDVYFATLIITAVSAACLMSPTTAHRIRFHNRDRAWIIETASRWMLAGMAFLSLAMGGAVLLIADILFDGARVWVYTGAMWAFIAAVWFVRPLLRHANGKSSGP